MCPVYCVTHVPGCTSLKLAGRHAIVIGAGIAGLGAALELGQRGARVTLLESDKGPADADPDSLFSSWQRPGALQVRHSHVFLGRLRNHLRDQHPELLAALMGAGARELRPTDRPPLALHGLQPEAGDDDLVSIGCRRTTFEQVLRAHVLREPNVELVGDTTVTGLIAARHATPIAAGVTCTSQGRARRLRAHWVIDASGRQSAAPEWLSAIDARPHFERSEPSGIVYYTRFYRKRSNLPEPGQTEHPIAADFDWVKYAVFPADGGTFSITLAVPLAIQRLKILSRPAAFDALVSAIPALAPWVAPEFAAPIGDPQRPVQAMGALINRLRRFVDDNGPTVLRFFVIGDAAYCTNPLYGRGCAQALIHAHALARALEQNPDDMTAAAIELDRWGRETLEPFYRVSILADRDAVRRAEGRAPEGIEQQMRERFFRDGVEIGLRCDPVVYRAFLRMLNMLATPEAAFSEPQVLARCLWVLGRSQEYKARYPIPPLPERDVMIARCEAALQLSNERPQVLTTRD